MQLAHSAYRKVKPKKRTDQDEIAEFGKYLAAKWRRKDKINAEKEVERILKMRESTSTANTDAFKI